MAPTTDIGVFPMPASPIVHKKSGPTPRPIADRFWEKVNKTDGCWLWTSATDRDGYGVFTVKRGTVVSAHRFAYELSIGEIPNGFQIDHLCRVPACCNPQHMEVVTPRENTLRGFSPWANAFRTGKCINGHPYNDENTYYRPDGRGRECKACQRDAVRRYRNKQSEITT